uniref:Uncharacterized protein n=1 Tax=Plectus sambesii TaxID=2011161 RepID=A0A914WT96_9BILA
MQECWKDKPDERPLFSDLKMEFDTLLSYATEEYEYLDIGKPSDGQYYQQISSDSGSTEQSESHPGESTAPINTERKSKVDASTGASLKSDAKDFV